MDRQSLLSTLDLWHQMSLGNVESSYLLTTAENELGVVVAHSESGTLTVIHCDHKVATKHHRNIDSADHQNVDHHYFLFCYSGAVMVPISWSEMQCPLSYAKEFRKVARVQPKHLEAWRWGKSPTFRTRMRQQASSVIQLRRLYFQCFQIHFGLKRWLFKF